MANAAEKQWLTTIATWYENHGFIDDDLNEYQFQLHHCMGRTAKHNKVHIGNWFVLPLPVRLHDVNSNDKLNVTHHRHDFTAEFGLQSELFMEMVKSMRELGVEIPFDCDVINSIMSAKR